MSGHSKWSTIKRAKEATDKKRASKFTKLSKDIANAAKLGESGDISMNPMLKVAVDKAKAGNMPNDNIQRAINRGLGISDSDDKMVENTYEFYGPSGSALIVECETDNPNRAITYLKAVSNRYGLKMASEGSISWQFEEKGVIDLSIPEGEDIEEVMLEAMDFEGVNDIVKSEEMELRVFVDKTALKAVTEQIKKKLAKIVIRAAEIVKTANIIVDITSENAEKLTEIESAIQEIDDVVNIWKNYEL